MDDPSASWRPAPTSFRLALPSPTAANDSTGGVTLGAPAASELPSWWSGVGGPALITVFVAVGCLAILVGALLVLRALRVYPTHGPVTVARLKKRPPLGEKPRIYELPVAYGRDGFGRESVAKWDGLVPISAAFLAEDHPTAWSKLKRASTISSTSSDSRSDTHSMHAASPDYSSVNAFNWRPRPAHDASVQTPEGVPEHPPLPDNMQIAVAIAMPRPPSPTSSQDLGSGPRVPPGLEYASRPEEVPELCLGFTQVQGVGTEDWRELHATAEPLRPLEHDP